MKSSLQAVSPVMTPGIDIIVAVGRVLPTALVTDNCGIICHIAD